MKRVGKLFWGTVARVFVVVLLTAILMLPTAVVAMSDEQRRLFDLGIPYYDIDEGEDPEEDYTYNPCINGGGDLNAPRPDTLKGANNEEKVWNYFRERGLSDIAVAGIMGNIKGESEFDPFKIESGVATPGWGIMQWTPATAFNSDKESDTPSSIVAGASSGDNDLYLLWQLHAIWNRGTSGSNGGGSNFWIDMNKEVFVGSYKDPIPTARSAGGTQYNNNPSNKTPFGIDYKGKGSAYYFQAAIERSGDMDWGLDGSGKPNGSKQYTNSSGDTRWHGNIRKRPYHAEQYLSQYGGGSIGGGIDDCDDVGTDIGGNDDIVSVAKTPNGSGLACWDCVAFVNSVYYKAFGDAKKLPFSPYYDKSGVAPKSTGSVKKLTGIYVLTNTDYFEITDSPVPGDIAVWSPGIKGHPSDKSGHVAIYLGPGLVSEGGATGTGQTRTGQRTARTGGRCNINGKPWNSLNTAMFLHYKGD